MEHDGRLIRIFENELDENVDNNHKHSKCDQPCSDDCGD